jgi:hypothetical protein
LAEAEQERRELFAELAEIESDLAKQIVRVYRRGTNYEEFWELVDRLRTFSEMRKNICDYSLKKTTTNSPS